MMIESCFHYFWSGTFDLNAVNSFIEAPEAGRISYHVSSFLCLWYTSGASWCPTGGAVIVFLGCNQSCIKLVLMLSIVVYLFNGKVKYEKMLEPDSDISSKATGPIVTKFHVEPPRAEGTKICSNSPDDITNMDLHGKNF